MVPPGPLAMSPAPLSSHFLGPVEPREGGKGGQQRVMERLESAAGVSAWAQPLGQVGRCPISQAVGGMLRPTSGGTRPAVGRSCEGVPGTGKPEPRVCTSCHVQCCLEPRHCRTLPSS